MPYVLPLLAGLACTPAVPPAGSPSPADTVAGGSISPIWPLEKATSRVTIFRLR
ncbi:MAG TPA: hypothetical protein VFT96_00215 [Gemmatimonadaceae bacterium]|nr:hypothetical protein [Gemmatimonadaceae bacterium]